MLLPRLRRYSSVFVVLLTACVVYAREDSPNLALNWKIIGPFENTNCSAFARRLDAERPFDTLTYKNARGGQLSWRDETSSNDGYLSLHYYNPERYGAYLVNTFVESGSQQQVTLHASIIGTAMIYVNDSLAFSSGQDIVAVRQTPIARVTLEKGWNRISVKVGNCDVPMCTLRLFMTDGSGNALQGVSSTSEPRLYPLRTIAPEPLTIPDSLFDWGFDWDDAFTDSLMRSMDDRGITPNGQLLAAVEKKQRGLMNASLEHLRSVVGSYPDRYDAWFLKANTHLELNQRDSAMLCLEQGLLRDPGAYGPTATLRRLKGLPDLFSYFRPINADSIIAAGFSAQPRDSGQVDVILRDDRIVVVSGGSSVVQSDWIFRALDPTGARILQNCPIKENVTMLSMQVTDYKHYGDSVSATPANNSYVLDNVAVGDLVRVRMRYILRDTTSIPEYFQYRHYIQGDAYTHRSVFQILFPKTDKFQWRTYNTLAEPTYSESPYGHLLLWDEMALKQTPEEQDAPRSDFKAMIEVGTTPTWEYVAQRFTDAFERNRVVPDKIRMIMDTLAPKSDSLSQREVIQRVREFFMFFPMTVQSFASEQRYRSIVDIAEHGPKSYLDFVTMFVSMLSTRGITAYPMLVDTTTTPFFRPPVPSVPFNHVIVVVPGDSLPSFFDFSHRPSASIYSLPSNVRGAFGLVVRRGLREPMFVPYDSSMVKYEEEFYRIVPDNSGQASMFQSSITTELDSSLIRQAIIQAQMHTAPGSEVEERVWCEPVRGTPHLKFCRSSKSPSPFRPSTTDSQELYYEIPWSKSKSYPSVPYDTNIRTLPLLRRWNIDSSVVTVVIHAPSGYTFSKNLPKGIFNVEGLRYSLLSIQRGDSLVVTRKVINTQPYVSPEGYVSFQVAHARMIELDKQPIQLVPIPVDTGKRKKKK